MIPENDTIAPHPGASRRRGLLIVGHGSTVNPDSATPTLRHADEIRARQVFDEVYACFWKEEPGLREAHALFTADEIYVVPNFISEGYFTIDVIPRELRLSGPVSAWGGRTWKYCEPVGNHEKMTNLLLQRAHEVAPGVPENATSLIVVGHGTGLNDNSAVAAKTQVARIAEMGIYGEVLNSYMEEAPLISEWEKFTKCPNVVVVPFFIADGLHSYQDIPVLLGIESEPTEAASKREVFATNPHHLRGKTLYYASAIGTEPGFADIILDQVARFDAAPASEPVE